MIQIHSPIQTHHVSSHSHNIRHCILHLPSAYLSPIVTVYGAHVCAYTCLEYGCVYLVYMYGCYEQSVVVVFGWILYTLLYMLLSVPVRNSVGNWKSYSHRRSFYLLHAAAIRGPLRLCKPKKESYSLQNLFAFKHTIVRARFLFSKFAKILKSSRNNVKKSTNIFQWEIRVVCMCLCPVQFDIIPWTSSCMFFSIHSYHINCNRFVMQWTNQNSFYHRFNDFVLQWTFNRNREERRKKNRSSLLLN